jgi:hypothetical protein
VLELSSATNTTANLFWNTVAEAQEYQIFANGKPVHITQATTFAHAYLSYFHSPVQYYVVAIDSAGNESTASNSIYVDDTNGGNKPLAIFVPGIGNGTASHETTSCPDLIVGTSYACTPTSLGGASLTWTNDGLPTGTTMNSGTGAITDASANSISKKYFSIIATDSDSSVFKLWTDAENGSSDVDGDGWSAGANDSNDLDSNIHVGNPSQASPTNLSVSTDGSNLTLTWTAADPIANVFYIYGGYSLDYRFWGEITYEAHVGTSPGSYSTDKFVGRAKRDSSGDPTTTISPADFPLSSGTNYISVTAHDFRGLESTPESAGEISFNSLNGNVYGAYFSEGEDEDVGIVETNDGGVVLVSFTESYTWLSTAGEEVRNIIIVKSDAAGTEQWRKIIGPSGYNIITKRSGAENNYHWVGLDIIETGTDDLIVSGYRNTASTGYDGFLMKFNSAGENTWDVSYNRTGSVNDYLFDVMEKSGGGFAVAGSSYVSSTDALLLLVDSSGGSADYNVYNTNGAGWEQVRRVRQTSDGGFIIWWVYHSGYDLFSLCYRLRLLRCKNYL